MVFRNNFFFVESACRGEGGAAYVIRLHAEHEIYRAHFPGEPITPGVCILQMGLELLSDAVGEKVELCRAKNVKFLRILHPEDGPVAVRIGNIEIGGGSVSAAIDFSLADSPVAKMSLVCRMPVK